MTAVDIKEPGGPEMLVPVKVPLPALQVGEILIRNQAVGVNRPDVAQRTGHYPVPADANPLPGLEVAGEVVAIGESSGEWQVGDKVMGLTHGGGYAEFTAVQHSHCLPWPKNFNAEMAAAIPENFYTVYYNVFMRSRLKAGEYFLVHGGSSGIGLAAIQMAKAKGAIVIATAGSSEKCNFCLDQGADKTINYKDEDWPEIAKTFTEGHGVDVVLDMVTGEYVQKEINIMARDGRIALIAFLGGPKAEINFGRVLRDRITISGSTLRPQTNEEKALITSKLNSEFGVLMDEGNVRPHIFKTFPLEQASDAHILMESSAHMGKIVLTID
ncbi:MAG TPA: NAD(P)H-quinone oxidoreductase [Rhodospirillales bacterium]|nr:NAD(P)H-quinone oxidoreductase [Rhodospirillales bacterium]HIL76778.1 NAD(P)H-quinone oxidoreductase [Rhodospirillales bacterium]